MDDFVIIVARGELGLSKGGKKQVDDKPGEDPAINSVVHEKELIDRIGFIKLNLPGEVKVFFVYLCGFAGVGASLRWLISRQFNGSYFFYGTMAVNLLGSFLAGVLLYGLFTGKYMGSKILHEALLVGLLGAFTTFSSFSLENVRLIQEGQWLALGANVGAQVVGGILVCYLGYSLAGASA